MRSLLVCSLLLALAVQAGSQDAKPLPTVDARYKADILLVVAHPDDEGAATAYLARALDEGKHVAVVFGTRGSSGGNEVGSEQASALGAIREIEARRALGTLGITNVWFLGGKDTASQDVLQSLANWDHGAALEQLVRLVRLTRPEVMLTFLPGTFIGEDHGDHQASGVLATEAFDLAGDPTVFPSQVAAPLRRLEPYLEGLQPWQPKKIYYFPDVERFVLGKSLVGGSVTGPVFENITADAILFRREAFSTQAAGTELSVELAGPWKFYAEFRKAHGLENLPHPEPPEIALQAGGSLVIPLWVHNPTGASREVNLSADLPAGWTVANGAGKFVVASKQTVPARIEIN